MRSIGIDIETRTGANELVGIPGLSGKDELPIDLAVGNEVILLSIKEAVFKASNPILRHQIDFEDVSLSWTHIANGSLRGVADAIQSRLISVVPQ